MKNDELLHKWYNKTITEIELEEFKKRPEFNSLTALDVATEGLEGPDFDEESMLNDILSSDKSRINDNSNAETTPKVFKLSNWIKYGVAASLLCLIGYIGFTSNDNRVSYEIADAQEMEGTLPDHSTFNLIGNSKLTYDKGDWANDRTLTLYGEAFFSVEKGSTFTVDTPNGQVAVLGTQFNVTSLKDELKVKCKEGKVSVKSEKGERYDEILLADESMTLNASGQSITWKNGLTKMKNVTLAMVTEQLSKQYGINITSEGLNLSESLSCNFQHTDLDLALKTTITSLGLKYNMLGDNKVKLYK